LEKRTGLSGQLTTAIITHAYFVVSEAEALFGDTPAWKDREGGCFCLADAVGGFPYAVVFIGSMLVEKSQKYLALSQEKALRLALNPNHRSSWESRDPDKQKWAGAVRVGDLIFSFSGLPDLGDEAIMLATASAFYLENGHAEMLQVITAIAAQSHNPYWEPLCEFLSRHR
jgi:hypothetical protein